MSFGDHFYRTDHKNDDGVTSGVGLHGTGLPMFNGTNVSHGCVRVDNKTMDEFYDIAPNHGAGTKIIMYDQLGGKI
jgi:lipoprotein-anchoring transpeptidase ErfK/SrfK